MHELPQDERHLRRALELARTAAAFASPNPTVGCVLAREEQILGEGAHFYDRRDHAEIAALKDAAARGQDARGATAYVTLEPCSHHGRTAPCADALIAAGISRCVIATLDPNPLVRGTGVEKMRKAGIDVLILDNAVTREARRLNDAFAFSIQHGRPFVTLKAALSVDGKLAPPPSQRTTTAPYWLTGEAARADVQQLRHASDAILTGIGTILADDPLLTDRTGLARRRPLLRVILDSQLRTPASSQIVHTAADDVLVCCAATAPAEHEQELRSRGVDVQRISGSQAALDLNKILAVLSERALRSVLLEAGPTLNGSFLSAGLADRLVFYFSETELGNDALPFAHGTASPYVLQQELQQVDRSTFRNGTGEDVRISGYLHDPWFGLIPSL